MDKRLTVCVSLLAAMIVSVVVPSAQRATKPAVGTAKAVPYSGGNGTLYIGGWPNKIFVVDEATEKVTGSIDVTTGDPTRMVLSRDRKRFYLLNSLGQSVEIIDVAARKSVDHFTLSEGRKRADELLRQTAGVEIE